jgi:hypothetical protein
VQPAVSPDGKLLAYTSDDSGRMEIYLQPLSGAGARIRVSAQGGELPIWSRTGRELYYIEESTLVAVGVGPDGKSLSAPDRLFSGSDVSSPLVEPGGNAMITLGPGSDFLVVQRRLPGNPAVVSMQNWTQLLENKG